MEKHSESSTQLRERILAAMLKDIGISERMARPFVDSVMGCFAGERLYFPANARSYPVQQIREALEQGERPDVVCRKFDLSRRQLNRIFPGGIPKARARSYR